MLCLLSTIQAWVMSVSNRQQGKICRFRVICKVVAADTVAVQSMV